MALTTEIRRAPIHGRSLLFFLNDPIEQSMLTPPPSKPAAVNPSSPPSAIAEDVDEKHLRSAAMAIRNQTHE
ncbi:hypothetical protein ACLOJK_036978 [Asimina triloba]